MTQSSVRYRTASTMLNKKRLDPDPEYILPDPQHSFMQCSGSRMRCLFDPRIRDPGWVKIKIRIRGIRNPDEHPGSYFRELRNNFFLVKILKFFDEDADPDPGNLFHPGSGMEKSDPGSGINIPDPQHWVSRHTLQS